MKQFNLKNTYHENNTIKILEYYSLCMGGYIYRIGNSRTFTKFRYLKILVMLLNKTLYIITGILIYTLFIVHTQPETDLEIYTSKDIYYINGLVVTTEATNEIHYFNNNEELKTFISDVTAEQIK